MTQRNGSLVSIGIPTYNNPAGLKRTLECITSQTYRNLEIIISDNFSPSPETASVIEEISTSDFRIRYYRQEKNIGATANFKFVLEKATGDFFMWAADDDEWLPTFISTLLEPLQKYPEVSVAMCGVKRIDESGIFFDIVRFSEFNGPDYNLLRAGLYAACNDVITFYIYGLYRLSFLKRFYQNLDDSFGKDLIIVTEMLMSSKFFYVDKFLHIRKLYLKQGTAERYSDEGLGRNYGDRLNYLKLFLNFGPFLFRSKNIPKLRKFLIPFMVIRQGLWVGNIYWLKIISSILSGH